MHKERRCIHTSAFFFVIFYLKTTRCCDIIISYTYLHSFAVYYGGVIVCVTHKKKRKIGRRMRVRSDNACK